MVCNRANAEAKRMTDRAHINLTTKLASALLALGHIPYSHAKLMSAEQIISLYQFHHNILHSTVPINEPWNIEPMLYVEHRKRFPIDAAVAAKIKRLTGQTRTGPRKQIPQRADGGWPAKGSRKLQSKPFEKRP